MENSEEIYNRTVINRLLTMYDNMLESSVQSYVQLNNNIRTFESGMREILSHQININNNYSRPRNNNDHINSRNPLPESLLREMSNYNNNNRPLNTSYRSYTRNETNNNRSSSSHSNRPDRPNRPNRPTRVTRTTRPVAEETRTPIILSNLDTNSNDLLRAFFPATFTGEELNNLSPVIVRPSTEQIERISEIIPFSLANSSNDRMCPITQREFIESDVIIRLRGCGHCFLQLPINSWFARSVLCPVCRYDVRNYTTINDISNNEEVMEDDVEEDTVDEDEDVEQNTTNVSDSPAMSELVNVMSSQLSQAINNQLTSGTDLSLNNLDNRGLNLEYTLESPEGGFTISSTSTASIGEILRNFSQPPNRQQ